jgi:hypothetical protein
MASMVSLCGSAFAQNFSMEVANTDPLGLGSFVPPALDFALEGGGGKFKGDLRYGAELDTVYNSNFFLTDGNEEDEFSAFLSPWFRYNSDPEGGAKYTLTANYLPVIRTYVENSDLNDIDHSGNVSLRIEGSRSELTVFGRYAELSGTDRLTGDFTSGSVFTGGLRASRQIASRTSLFGGISMAVSDYGNTPNEGAEVMTAYVGGMWASSPRFSVGPNFRYTNTDSGNIGERDAYALLLETRYRLGEKIWLEARLGPEYSETSGATSDSDSLGFTGDLSARYMINDRLAWTTSFRSDTIPSPSETNYLVNDFSLTTALHRQFVRGTLSGGLQFRFSNYEDVGTTAITREDETNYGIFMEYRRNLFSDRVAFESLARYSFNDGQTDWKQFFLSAGFNVAF